MDISVVGFNGYIGINQKISVKILTKNIGETKIDENS